MKQPISVRVIAGFSESYPAVFLAIFSSYIQMKYAESYFFFKVLEDALRDNAKATNHIAFLK